MKPKVEETVPLVDPRQKYPWDTMKVGDSFFLSYSTDRKLMARRVAGAMAIAAKKHKAKYTLKTTTAGVRVWRVE